MSGRIGLCYHYLTIYPQLAGCCCLYYFQGSNLDQVVMIHFLGLLSVRTIFWGWHSSTIKGFSFRSWYPTSFNFAKIKGGNSSFLNRWIATKIHYKALLIMKCLHCYDKKGLFPQADPGKSQTGKRRRPFIYYQRCCLLLSSLRFQRAFFTQTPRKLPLLQLEVF